MNQIFFGTVEIAGHNEDNKLFYTSEEEARKDIDSKIHEEIRNVQKLINDYNLDAPILSYILKHLTVNIKIRQFVLQEEERAS